MLKTSKYSLKEKLHTSANFETYLAVNNEDNNEYIAKHSTPKGNIKSIKLLCNEYKISTQYRFDSTSEIVETGMDDDSFWIISKKYQLINLFSYMDNFITNAGDLILFLTRISEAVKQFHDNLIVLNNITIDNFMIEHDTHKIRILNYGESADLNIYRQRELPQLSESEQNSWINRYMSINCTLDERSDLYSLGLLFYALYSKNSSLNLLGDFRDTQKDIIKTNQNKHPPTLEEIIYKLTDPYPEKRYCSINRLISDLKNISKKGRDDKEQIADSVLHLRFPSKLYGRESEIKLLSTELDRCTIGIKSLILIKGQRGIGKTSLIRESEEYGKKSGYLVLNSACTENMLSYPYSSIVNSLEEFLLKIFKSTNSTKDIKIKSDIVAALGESGISLLSGLIKNLEFDKYINKSPEMLLSDIHRIKHLNNILVIIMEIIARSNNTILISIDNAHIMDSDSGYFIKDLLENKNIKNIVVMLGIRSGKINSYFETYAPDNLNIRKLDTILSGLVIDDIYRFIKDSTGMGDDTAYGITGELFKKTNGNPDLLREYMVSLYENGIIRWDERWICDFDKFADFVKSNTIIDLYDMRIGGLNKGETSFLKIAAVCGKDFKLTVLKECFNFDPIDLSQIIISLENRGIIFNGIDDDYVFQRDHYYDAIRSHITAEEFRSYNSALGFYYMRIADTDIICKIKTTDYLNEVVEDLDQTTKEFMIESNYQAALYYKENVSYEKAYKYIKKSIYLVENLGSQVIKYNNKIKLFYLAIELSYLSGDEMGLDKLYRMAKDMSISVEDRAKIDEFEIEYLMSRYRIEDALNKGVDALNKLGLPSKREPKIFDISRSIIKLLFYSLLNGNIEKIEKRDYITDDKITIIIKILVSMGSGAYFLSRNLVSDLIFKLVYLTFKHGLSDLTPFIFSSYSIVLCGPLNRIDLGFRYAKIAERLLLRYPNKHYYARTVFMMSYFALHWKEESELFLENILEAARIGYETGDYEYSSSLITIYILINIYSGKNLYNINKKYEELLPKILEQRQERFIIGYKLYGQLIHNLLGRNEKYTILDGYRVKSDEIKKHINEDNDKSLNFIFKVHKLVLSYLFEDYLEGMIITDSITDYDNFISTPTYIQLLFFSALTFCALLNENPGNHSDLKHKLFYNLKKMEKINKMTDGNFINKITIIKGAYNTAIGNDRKGKELLENGIKLSDKMGKTIDVAVANEIMAKAYIKNGYNKIGAVYLHDAYISYENWGCEAKLKFIESNYHDFITAWWGEGAIPATSQGNANSESLLRDKHLSGEIDTILKMAQIISGEVSVSGILDKLLSIIMGSISATKGVFTIEGETRNTIVLAMATHENENIYEFRYFEKQDSDDTDKVAKGIINYTRRNKLPLILDYTGSEVRFCADPYIVDNKPKSVISMPMIIQDKYLGTLYFENNSRKMFFDGSKIPLIKILISQAAISIENSRLYEKMSQEIEKRLIIEESLRESETKYKNLSDLLPQTIFEIDTNGKFLFCNKFSYDLFGFTEDDIKRGMNILEIISKEDRVRCIENIKKVIAETSHQPEEYMALTKDERKIPVLIYATPVIRDNKTDGIRGIAVDITNQKAAEEEINRLNKDLEKIVEERTFELKQSLEKLKNTQAQLVQTEKLASLGGLVAGIAHEVNTPLGIGITAVSYIMDEINNACRKYKPDNDSELHELFRSMEETATMILKNLEKAAMLIKNFKEIAVDQTSEELREINLRSYIYQIIFSLTPKIKKFKINLSVDCPDNIRMSTYPGALSQILNNLIMNTIIHGYNNNPDGKIDIIVTRQNDFITIIYRDYGCGISNEIINKIYDPFFTTKRGSGGSGLGMNIVYNLVAQKLGGRISCNSDKGQGVEFTITLPIAIEHL